MNLHEHHLLMLMEECAEVAHRASKQMRFGAYEIQPGQACSNRERLREEILDVLACVQFLEESGQIEEVTGPEVTAHIEAKRDKITRMLDLSRSQGCLSSSATPTQEKT